MKKTILAALLCGAPVWALPEGGQVVQGNLQLTQPGANVLQILQSSPTGIINWNSFSIDAHQLVQFLQPNSAAAVLNRVIGQDPSQILGQLQANGRVLLINPNGILFGPNSVVDTGSFLASTLTISDQDFLQGRYNLQWDQNSPMRAVVNQGQIKVADGGFIALVSPVVDNQGLLVAQSGQVVLGATRQASLTVDARGLLTVVMPDGFRGQSSGSPQPVLLTPNQMSDTLAHLVSLSNQADSIVETPQGIRLAAAEGTLLNQGRIEAGQVRLDSSQATLLDSTGSVSGDDLRIFSAGSAVSLGVLRAGFVELSAPHIGLTRAPELTPGGTLLLDPDNIHITNTGLSPDVTFATSPGVDVNVDAAALNVTGGGLVRLQADQSIFFDVPVAIDQPEQLQLTATQDIVMNVGTSLTMTDPTAIFQATAGGDIRLRDVAAPTTHANAGGTVFFEGGSFGQAGSNTLVNVSAGAVSFTPGSLNNFVGQRLDMPVKSTTGDILVGSGSQLNLQGTTSNNLTLESNGVARLESNASLSATGPSTLNITAGSYLIMDTGSSITATDSASVLRLTAGNATDITTLNLPTIHSTSGEFARFDGGTVGVAGAPTFVNVSAPFVRTNDASITNVLGTDVNVTLASQGLAAQDVGFQTNSRLNVLGTTSNNVTLSAPLGVVFFDPGTSLTTSAVLSHVLITGGSLNMGAGTLISEPDPASDLVVQSTAASLLAGAQVSTIQVNSGSFTSFVGGTLGLAGSPTLVQANGTSVRIGGGSTVNVQGTDVNVTFTTNGNASDDVGLELGSRLNLLGTTSNNVTMSAPTATVFFDPDTSLVTSNALSQVNLSGQNLNMGAGSRIVEPQSASTLDANFSDHASVFGLEVPTVNLHATQFIQFLGGTLGQAGSDTLITALSDLSSSNVFANSNVSVVGQNVRMDLSSTAGNVAFGDNSTLNLNGTASNRLNAIAGNSEVYVGQQTRINSGPQSQLNFNSATGQVIQRNDSAITVTGSGNISMVGATNVVVQEASSMTASRLDASAQNVSLEGNANIPVINATASPGDLTIGGQAGVAGQPLSYTGRGGGVFVRDLTLRGSQVDWTLNSTARNIELSSQGGSVQVGGNNNHLDWTAANFIGFHSGTLINAPGTTQFNILSSTQRPIMDPNSTILLPDASSNIFFDSQFTPQLHRVVVGGNLTVIGAGGAGLNITDQLVGNQVNLQTPGLLFDGRSDGNPAIVATSLLNVTAANISGPVNLNDVGLVNGLAFSTGSGAQVRFNLTGANSTALGNRAANLFYAYPQSGNIQVLHPNGDVLIYNEPAPPVASTGSPRVIRGRGDLTAAELAELTNQTSQAQVQLSSLYSVADLPALDDVLLLQYSNTGLTGPYSIGYMVSAVVERVVLNPEDAAQVALRRRADRPEVILLAGNDEDEELLYWRRLIQGFIIWEDE